MFLPNSTNSRTDFPFHRRMSNIETRTPTMGNFYQIQFEQDKENRIDHIPEK